MRFKGNTSHSRIRKDSRRIAVFGDSIRGDGLDAGKWYRCWNCGFMCNSDRNALGDSQARDGIVLKDYAQVRDDHRGDLILGKGLIISENDSEGNPKTVKNALMVSESSYGCPLCGTLNWRGDY